MFTLTFVIICFIVVIVILLCSALYVFNSCREINTKINELEHGIDILNKINGVVEISKEEYDSNILKAKEEKNNNTEEVEVAEEDVEKQNDDEVMREMEIEASKNLLSSYLTLNQSDKNTKNQNDDQPELSEDDNDIPTLIPTEEEKIDTQDYSDIVKNSRDTELKINKIKRKQPIITILDEDDQNNQ